MREFFNDIFVPLYLAAITSLVALIFAHNKFRLFKVENGSERLNRKGYIFFSVSILTLTLVGLWYYGYIKMDFFGKSKIDRPLPEIEIELPKDSVELNFKYLFMINYKIQDNGLINSFAQYEQSHGIENVSSLINEFLKDAGYYFLNDIEIQLAFLDENHKPLIVKDIKFRELHSEQMFFYNTSDSILSILYSDNDNDSLLNMAYIGKINQFKDINGRTVTLSVKILDTKIRFLEPYIQSPVEIEINNHPMVIDLIKCEKYLAENIGNYSTIFRYQFTWAFSQNKIKKKDIINNLIHKIKTMKEDTALEQRL